jgi:hypothetical protein
MFGSEELTPMEMSKRESCMTQVARPKSGAINSVRVLSISEAEMIFQKKTENLNAFTELTIRRFLVPVTFVHKNIIRPFYFQPMSYFQLRS